MSKKLEFDLDNLLSPAVLENPYPIYQQLRTTDPVHWNPIVGAWILTRYADVFSAFQDPRFLSAWGSYAGRSLSEEEQAYMDRFMLYWTRFMVGMDGPEHIRQRALVNRAFNPRMLERIRPRIEQIVDELLDTARATGQIEVISDLAFPLPSTVILELLGIPLEGRTYVKSSSYTLGLANSLPDPAPGQLKQMANTIQEVEEYLKLLIAERRKYPQDNLLSILANIQEGGKTLRKQEIIIISTMLLFAGHETTTNLIGNGLLALLRHPNQLERLKANPALIGPAVEELLRYDAPVQFAFRTVNEDIEINNRVIKKGQRVMLGIGAANHDPEQFTDPDKLDIGRRPGRALLSFGYGTHFCIGAALARLEGQIALSALLHLPDLRLATDKVEWRVNFVFRGLQALPLIFQSNSLRSPPGVFS